MWNFDQKTTLVQGMRYFLPVIFACTVGACSSPKGANLHLSANPVRSIAVKDNRPEPAKTRSKIFHDTGAYTTLGDQDIKPLPIELIQQWANSSALSIPANSQITVDEFTVTFFEPDTAVDQSQVERARQSTPGASPLAGVFAGWLIEGIESMRKDKPVTFKMTGTLNDKPFEARAHSSFKGRLNEEDIGSVITLGLSNAAESVATALTHESTPAK